MSSIMPPRPKRASRPVMEKSVIASTRVPGVLLRLVDDRRLAPPCPRLSVPRAFSVAVWVLSSALSILIVPAVGRGRRPELDLEGAVVGAVLVVVGDGRRRAGRAPRARGRSGRATPARSARRRRRTARASYWHLLEVARGCRCRSARRRCPASHGEHARTLEQGARALVALELGARWSSSRRSSTHGMPGRAVVDGPHRALPSQVVERAGDHLRRDERLVAERDRPRRRPRRARPRPRAQRRRLPVRPSSRTPTGSAPLQVDLRADLVGARAEHDDDRLDRGHGEHRAERRARAAAARRSRASCLGPPKRVPSPAARTIRRLRLGSAAMATGHAGTPSSSSSASVLERRDRVAGQQWSTCGSAACIPRVSGS